jgi:hypothetical protein
MSNIKWLKIFVNGVALHLEVSLCTQMDNVTTVAVMFPNVLQCL